MPRRCFKGVVSESGPLRAVHLSRHQWPGMSGPLSVSAPGVCAWQERSQGPDAGVRPGRRRANSGATSPYIRANSGAVDAGGAVRGPLVGGVKACEAQRGRASRQTRGSHTAARWVTSGGRWVTPGVGCRGTLGTRPLRVTSGVGCRAVRGRGKAASGCGGCEDRVLDGPASGGKGSKGRN